ncbi:MAG TPA: hypothetical protein PK836_07030 [Syntrophales bacterium]|nr:hypothetical protein [Syntrophales bacterium]HOM07435.1 hypothetical protein [Syntrophales bacterium]HON99924.1 hypothetical protein [Syntrophales bacterium]HPC01422.1 hypothetical protein [Syntrophales bacterium]HPQ06946.1 hypothetical protein [Syntrophales bacterium]
MNQGKNGNLSILFVCTANIVRSFMAERIMREKLRKARRKDIAVSSAGLLDLGGSPADPTAVRLLKEAGIDGDDHRARALRREDLEAADIIVVMEKIHKELIMERYPEFADKVFLLKPFMKGCREGEEDIGDPHGKSLYHYRLALAEISLAVEGLIKCI